MIESNFLVEKMGIGYAALFNALETHRGRRVGGREDRAVQRHREEGLSPGVVRSSLFGPRASRSLMKSERAGRSRSRRA